MSTSSSSSLSLPRVPPPKNEPVFAYAPGSAERARLEVALLEQARTPVEIPLYVEADGRATRTGQQLDVRAPHDHALLLGRAHRGGAGEIARAIDTAVAAQRRWERTSFAERAAIFLRAAEAIAGRDRARIVAATMHGQSKTAHQAEIDAACELADFLRWNVWFAERILAEQPVSDGGVWNQSEARPLEGFVYAVTPFNFTAIAGNLPTAPALLGNTVVWKPADNAILSAWHVMEILREAGLPPGVINFVCADPVEVSRMALAHPMLAGIHFTGSTAVFQQLWKQTAENLPRYRSYPRIVGETGGKDFIVAHPSADLAALCTAIVRGGYEYQGQKCSAASRLYLPRSRWPGLRDMLVAELSKLPMGPVTDFSNFVGAVIDKKAFDRITGYQRFAKDTVGHSVIAGGGASAERGWFVEPTLVETADPKSRLMQEEIFGPLVTAFIYDDARWSEMLRVVDETSPYGLTGAVFSLDLVATAEAKDVLLHAAGNFYVNDKPTGAVVGQQPFGGGRASGTNDKAGSLWNLIRWVSPRTIKETLTPPRDWRYPYLGGG
jgi:1-pyrroline-5-carboxylate dehydrogenase